jgi:hypothetical protein
MEELYEIVKGLNNLLEQKQDELERSGRQIESHLMSELENRKLEIEGFVKGIAAVNVSNIKMYGVIENFKKSATEIRERISKVGMSK